MSLQYKSEIDGEARDTREGEVDDGIGHDGCPDVDVDLHEVAVSGVVACHGLPEEARAALAHRRFHKPWALDDVGEELEAGVTEGVVVVVVEEALEQSVAVFVMA